MTHEDVASISHVPCLIEMARGIIVLPCGMIEMAHDACSRQEEAQL